MFSLRLLQRFADYRYFREIADFMKIKVPLLNQEILLDNNRSCLVHGLKIIQPDPLLKKYEQGEQTQQKSVESLQKVESEEQQTNPPNSEVDKRYIFDKHSEATLTFDKAYQVSQTLGLDLCLIRNATETKDPVLSVSTVRKEIYSQYYHEFVKRKKKNQHKTIRLSDRINPNDLDYKYQNLKRMHEHGERSFRIESNNDSEKSEQILKEFCLMFGKKVEPRLKTFKVPPRNKTEERWICHILFDEEVQIDPKKVNKKWRSYKYEQKDLQNGDQNNNFEDFDVDSIEMERQIYQAYKELGLKMPKKYQDIADFEKQVQTDKFALYRVEEKTEEELNWDEEEERKFRENQAKFNSEYFGERTVEDILTEMEQLKSSGYQSEAYKVARFKQLKDELNLKLKKSNKEI